MLQKNLLTEINLKCFDNQYWCAKKLYGDSGAFPVCRNMYRIHQLRLIKNVGKKYKENKRQKCVPTMGKTKIIQIHCLYTVDRTLYIMNYMSVLYKCYYYILIVDVYASLKI